MCEPSEEQHKSFHITEPQHIQFEHFNIHTGY